MRYFVISEGGAKEGPFTLEGLKGLADKGDINPGTLLEPEEGGDAVTAGSIGGLFPYSAPPPPRDDKFAHVPPPSAGDHRNSNRTALIVLVTIGGLCLCGIGVIAAFLFPVFSQARVAAQQTRTMVRMRQLTTATITYAAEHDDALPPVLDTAQAAAPYLQPYLAGEEKPGEAFLSLNPRSSTILGNTFLAGADENKQGQPSLTLLFFDERDWETDSRRVVGMLDGSAKKLPGKTVLTAMGNAKGVLAPSDL